MINLVVLGGTSAIAIEACRLFAKDKSSILLVGRNENKLKTIQSDLLGRGAKEVKYLLSDLAEISSHKALFDSIEQEFPEYSHLLIAYGTLPDQKKCEENFEETAIAINSNFTSTVSLLTYFANKFEVKQKGTIAVITSVAGDRGRQSNYIYGAAKGGLSIFLQGLRNRLNRSGVSVVTIKPGFIDTPMTKELTNRPLESTAEEAGLGVYDAVIKGSDVVYVPKKWLPVMTTIKIIPEIIFKRLSL